MIELGGYRRLIRTISIVTAAALVLPAASVGALSIGEPQVLSNLGQPLRIRVPLTFDSANERDFTRVTLIPFARYDEIGLLAPPNDRGISGRVIEDGGQRYLWVESASGITEPVFDLAIEAKRKDFVSVRHVSVLLDPPDLPLPVRPAPAPAANAQATNALAPDALPAARGAAPTAVEVRPPRQVSAQRRGVLSSQDSVPNNSSVSETYGPVLRGETLSQISERIRPAGTDLWKYVSALASINTKHVEKDGTGLIVGSILRLPTLQQVQASTWAPAQSLKSAASPRSTPIVSRTLTSALFDGEPSIASSPVQAAASPTAVEPLQRLSRGGESVSDTPAMVRFSLSQTLSTESLTAIASQTMSQTADEIASEAAPSVAVQPAVVPAAAAPGGEPGAQSETRWPWYAWLALAAIGLLAIYGLFALIAVLRSWLVDLAEARASRMDAALEAKNAPLDSVAEPIQEFPLTAPPKLADQDHAIGESLADEVPDERLVLMHEISELMSRTPDQSLRSKLTLAEAMVESDRLTRARGLLAEVKQLLPKPSQSEQEALARWRKANSA